MVAEVPLSDASSVLVRQDDKKNVIKKRVKKCRITLIVIKGFMRAFMNGLLSVRGRRGGQEKPFLTASANFYRRKIPCLFVKVYLPQRY